MIKKICYIYTTAYYSAIKKNENYSISSNMDEPKYYHTKLSERQIPCDITYMWNLNYDTNEHVYKTEKTETDSQTEGTDLWLPRRRRGGGKID